MTTRILLMISLLTVSACGFKPIYAEPAPGARRFDQQVALNNIRAPQEVFPDVMDALNARFGTQEGGRANYNLNLNVTERAERLAVQIDATVTRYNYRLAGRYRLVDQRTGETISGTAESVTSYNIVASQYSTLFAENAAREKAAERLVELIERDLYIQFAELEGRLSPPGGEVFPGETERGSFGEPADLFETDPRRAEDRDEPFRRSVDEDDEDADRSEAGARNPEDVIEINPY